MIGQLGRYFAKLVADGCADAERSAIFAQDDEILGRGCDALRPLGQAVLQRLNTVSLVVAAPPLPLLEVLLGRLPAAATEITPLDTETRTFLHDIPLVRRCEFSVARPQRLVELLGRRKGILVEGVGIMATGSFTVELAYINYSSVYHALFIKVLLDLLLHAAPTEKELELLRPLWTQLRTAIPESVERLPPPAPDRQALLRAIDAAGRRTVELKLVDSFFGNISCRSGRHLYISQTGASLDDLAGCIDLVADDNSSTAGLTASSELIAHRAIYQQTDAATILHGHPKFSVLLSLLCDESDCPVEDCWKDCRRVRSLAGTPVVAGEVGAGGIARLVPPVIAASGTALVYGHGVFAIGREDFVAPLLAMIRLENYCRRDYLKRLQARLPAAARLLPVRAEGSP